MTHLGKQGARGALFKITLISRGYTFLGKERSNTIGWDRCGAGILRQHGPGSDLLSRHGSPDHSHIVPGLGGISLEEATPPTSPSPLEHDSDRRWTTSSG